jgi:hypothetical protein
MLGRNNSISKIFNFWKPSIPTLQTPSFTYILAVNPSIPTPRLEITTSFLLLRSIDQHSHRLVRYRQYGMVSVLLAAHWLVRASCLLLDTFLVFV